MPRKKKDPELCRVDGCENKAYSREVCQKHGEEFRDLVKLGLYTDEELVEKGYWAKAKPSGRPVQRSKTFEKLVKAKSPASK